jgi:hypothetical protein
MFGQELSTKHLAERLAGMRPDWVRCDCKGYPGYVSGLWLSVRRH